MGKKSGYILILIGLILMGCQPASQVSFQEIGTAKPTVQPASLPLAGASASRLGAAALMVQEKHSTQTFSILPVSADTGKPVADAQPAFTGGGMFTSFSSDRSEMAYLSNQTADCLTACLHRIDLRNWKEFKPVPLEGKFGAWFLIPTFDSNRASLPVIVNKQTESASMVELVDEEQARVTQQVELRANILKASYTPQGNLALFGIQTNPAEKKSLAYVGLLDGKDLNVLWEQTLAEIPFLAEWIEGPYSDPTQGKYLEPAAVFSSDGGTLYVVAADRPLLANVDFQKQAMTTHKIQPRTSLLDRFMAIGTTTAYAKTLNGTSKNGVLSQDGRRLYVVGVETQAEKNAQGDYEMAFAPLGLQVIDTRDETLVNTVKTEARNVLLDLDGKTLLLQGWREVKGGNAHPWTEVLDPESGNVLQHLEGTAYPSRLLDGSLAWLVKEQNFDNTSTLDIYRPGEAKPRSQVISPAYLDWVPIP